MRYEFTAELWQWAARSERWVFARLPLDISDEIHDAPHPPAGFGSVKVRAWCETTSWTTSIFPEAKDGAFVLPIKKAVRTKHGIDVGDVVSLAVDTLD